METKAPVVDFSLNPVSLSFSVKVRLSRAGDRWVARATARDEEQVGLGPSARHALTAALEPLGASAVRVLLADLGLLEPSIRVAEITAAGT